MLLSEQDDPLGAWQYAERYVGVGTRTYSRFAADLDISPECHPLTGVATVTLPTYRVPSDQGEFLRNRSCSEVNDLYHGGGGLLLPVHPDAVTHPGLVGADALSACEPGPPIEAVPSANARTVFVKAIGGEAVPPHFLKLHFPRRLSRFTRRLRRPVIELQLWTADELARVGVTFLPEVGGGVFGWDPQHSWGFLLRETSPAGDTVPPLFTVPLFALYGGDHHAPGDPTLLEQLVRAAGEPPEEFLTERVVRPMVAMWADVLARTGIALEPHGQNTLFRFSPDGRRTDITYRDCATYVDPEIRAHLGIGHDLPGANVISRDIPFPREQVFSLTYDTFMGHHALSYLARLAEDRWAVRPEALQESARSALKDSGGVGSLLPATVYGYDSALHPDGRFTLIDTGRPPAWR